MSPPLQYFPTLRGLALAVHQHKVHTGKSSQNINVSMLYNETPVAKSKSGSNPLLQNNASDTVTGLDFILRRRRADMIDLRGCKRKAWNEMWWVEFLCPDLSLSLSLHKQQKTQTHSSL